MNRVLCFASFLVLSCASVPRPAPAQPPPPKAATSAPPASRGVTLKFSDFFVAENRTPEPSPTLLSAAGKRVRMVGFMARMDEAPSGAFYLTPRPVSCDEMGAGTGDLPIETVRVNIVPPPKEVAFVPGPIEVVGVLELGRREEPDGAVSHIRLLLRLPSVSSAPVHDNHNN